MHIHYSIVAVFQKNMFFFQEMDDTVLFKLLKTINHFSILFIGKILQNPETKVGTNNGDL